MCIDCFNEPLRSIYTGPRTATFHRPSKLNDRYIGRMYLPAMAAEIEVAQLVAYDPNDLKTIKSTLSKWNASVVEDGSLDECGFEINTAPAQGKLLKEQLADICAAINAAGAEVNNSCGLHVHVDAQRISLAGVARIVSAMHRIEPLLYKIVAPSRADAEWCRPLYPGFEPVCTPMIAGDEIAATRNLAKMMWSSSKGTPKAGFYTGGKGHTARYRSLNIHSWAYRGSLEFRLHHGSTNANKIFNWATTCGAVVALGRKKSLVNQWNGMTDNEVLTTLAASEEHLNWMKSRIAHFRGA